MMLPTVPEWIDHVLAPNPGPMTLDGTNTWLVGGHPNGALVVIDPGPLDEPHLQDIAARGDVTLILLTHGHADHAEGASRLQHLTGASIAAFDASLLHGSEAMRDGDRLEHAELAIEVLHTPGHSADSLSFLVRGARDAVLITGDTILGRGTTMIDHPEGRLADYFATLERLRDVGEVLVLPGHGPVEGTAVAKATEYLRHRRERLVQVQAALDDGAVTAREVVERVYVQVPRELWPAAERSVSAQLHYLRGAP